MKFQDFGFSGTLFMFLLTGKSFPGKTVLLKIHIKHQMSKLVAFDACFKYSQVLFFPKIWLVELTCIDTGIPPKFSASMLLLRSHDMPYTDHDDS